MSDVVVQRVWVVGKTPVVTIPKEAREKIPDLAPGNYVKVYTDGKKLIIEPMEGLE